MPLNPDDYAELVVQTVESALGPVLQRLAAAEARLTMLGDVRDRVVAVEAKSAVAPEPLGLQDLDAIRQACVADIEKRAAQLATSLEAKSAVLESVAARVAALEASAEPPSVDALMAAMHEGLTSIKSSVSALERTGQDTGALDDLKARIGAIEGLNSELRDRVAALDGRFNGLPAAKDYAELRERVGVAEAFARQPGPAGPQGLMGPAGKDGLDGKDGRDGLNGKDGTDGLHGKDGLDGKDGLGFDDLDVALDGDRTLVLKFSRGSLKKTFPIVLPYQAYQGVYTDGKQYAHGDVVTWGGSQWYCKEDTLTKPGDGSRVWVLCVKKGRDGRDGKDAPGALPVVSVGRPQA